MSLRSQGSGAITLALLPSVTFTTAVANVLSTAITGVSGASYLVVDAVFTYGSSGGTNVTAYLQTALGPSGAWFDIMTFQFTTATARKLSSVIGASVANVAGTDATLAANTVQNGLIGDRLRIKYTSTGTYAGGTTLVITGYAKG